MSTVTVTITGHLADTPELRQTNSGTSVTNFRLIANDRRFDEDTQQWVDTNTTGIRVTAWGPLAENLVGTIAKGNHVTVEGSRLSAAAYTHRETGEPRASLELTADSVKVELA
ncbi:single-stranded DNA-binding protein, partial [Nocardia sp. NPDC048505]|uniref:single-stranded DNA-binding protein n=1 Tax=Nocardia sp. NPDC048505 TaxID=3155756 RepID=UPI0033FF5ABA